VGVVQKIGVKIKIIITALIQLIEISIEEEGSNTEKRLVIIIFKLIASYLNKLETR
jgi:hypothetical protein